MSGGPIAQDWVKAPATADEKAVAEIKTVHEDEKLQSDLKKAAIQLIAQPADLVQCIIQRNKKTSMFYLYLAASSSSLREKGKFLLAARKYRHATKTDYIISLDPNVFSQTSNAYVGKLRSNYAGTKFTIYDTQPPHKGAKPQISSNCFRSRQISPQMSAGNFEIGHLSYKLDDTKWPRRMVSLLRHDETKSQYVALIDKKPIWVESLKIWCLNFHGRVTVTSVKNFQLIDSSESDETVFLQFGEVGDEFYIMDYRHPFSAFQAFAICLATFGL